MSIKTMKRLALFLMLILVMAGLISCGAAGRGSSITILIPDDPVAFNGFVTDTGYEQAMGELIMLSLSEVDPDGNIFPELAVEIPTVENGGVVVDDYYYYYYNEYYGYDYDTAEYYGYGYYLPGMDVTWTIRDDVFWADGEQVTIDDVIFTWEEFTEETWVDGVDYVTSIEKINDFSLVVHYNTLYPNYQLMFGGENFFVYPEHYCDPDQSFYEWDCDRQPLSNGPYILEEWVTNDHLTFVRNPDYFEEGKPAIDEVIVRIVPEQSVRKSLMLEGDADAHYWPGDAIADEYETADNVDILVAPTERWVMRLIPNLAAYGETDPKEYPHPFLSQVEVRQAIRMAVDVDTIVEDIFYGNGHHTWTEFFRPPYACDIPQPEFDLEGAAALLEEAGWMDEDGDGVRECHGCPNAEEGTLMSMEFAIYAEYGEELELAQQLIAENLESIGFDVELLTIEGAVMWAQAEAGGTEQSGNFDLDMWDDGYPGTDPTDYQLWTFYSTDGIPENGGYNVGRWFNEDFDTLLWEAYTLDEEYRKELFCEMAEILEEELPNILLFTTAEFHGISTRLVGPAPSGNDPLTWNVADWVIEE